ncbi:MAG: hypothetical protein NXH81_08475 [Halieaceae bacterium]|uniref:hypothetical protein n=1 Tax=Haliea alexandrii TaxID=2448162 RepID=UPI001304A6CB|nr:hypothetical protein [Haliea alexandrii]MCR9185416.1 hypothetical protein [Halieaceae bacterium]
MQTQNARRMLSVLLLVSAIALSSLVPGGPIENRDFSHMAPATLLLFNIFLTALGLGSFLVVVGLLRGMSRAWPLSFWAAASYLTIYIADLMGWFPQSPTPMSPALVTVEGLGVVLALSMLWISSHHGPETHSLSEEPSLNLGAGFWLAMSALALGIVIFATSSATG